MKNVQNIEIDEEHVTIKYNQRIERRYNANEITHKEWVYKYNDDPEFVAAVRAVIELARKHLYDLPDNVACPPGCAECCSGYEPFVNRDDVQRIADHLGLTYDEVMSEYVVPRESADGYVVGWLRKVDEKGERSEDIEHKCVFLKGSRSGRYYCGIYAARPHDCGAFTPIGCNDVDWSLPRHGTYKTGEPFRPKRRRATPASNGKPR
jgi:Fe-S-cluster containining protein